MTWADRKELFAWLPKYRVGAELGVKDGESAQLLFDLAEPSMFYLIDYWSLPKPHLPHMQPELRRREKRYQHTMKRFAKPIASHGIPVIRETRVQATDELHDGWFD